MPPAGDDDESRWLEELIVSFRGDPSVATVFTAAPCVPCLNQNMLVPCIHVDHSFMAGNVHVIFRIC